MTMNTVDGHLWKEFREYTEEYRSSDHERRSLRDCVRSGHSVYETVGSMYLQGPSYPPMDFIDAYRLDRSIRDDTRGMTKAEKDAYLKSCMGWEYPSPEQISLDGAKRNTPKLVEDHVRRLERELFNLWSFVWQEGLGAEAREFVDERKEDEIPFEW